MGEAMRCFCGEGGRVEGAGRTDAGVHALAQVAHFDLEKDTTADTVMKAVNFHLNPAPVAVLAAEAAADGLHARFSAVRRAYLSRIVHRHQPPGPHRGSPWIVPLRPDAAHGPTARL